MIMEYFITNLGKSYPLCRFPDGNKIQKSKDCFKCADNPGKYDGDPIYHEDLCGYDGNGECFPHASGMICVRVCPYSCITASCPESREVAKYLCYVGEMSNEEKAYFEEEFEILVKEEKARFEEEIGEETDRQSKPDFKLLSMEELDLSGVGKKMEHQDLLDTFAKLSSSHPNIPEIRLMMECQELADKIRRVNQGIQANPMHSPVSNTPAPVTISTGTSKAKKTKRSPQGETIDDKLKKLILRRPRLNDSTAQELANILACSKAAIIATTTWKDIIGKRGKTEIQLWGDMGQIRGNRTEFDDVDDRLDAEN